MMRTSNINYNFNIILIVSHVVLAVTSAWALKNVDVKAPNASYNFTMTFAYSVFGILSHTHPHPGKFLRIITKICNRLIELVAIILYSVDVVFLSNWYSSTTFIISWTVAALVVTSNLTKTKVFNVLLMNCFVIWTNAILIYTTLWQAEPYWLVGMIILLTFNHLILDKALLSFNISSVHFYELSVIGFSFFVIFAVNSINELCSNVTLL